MPTADDEESAWIRFEGVVKRKLVRRPRIDRNCWFLSPRRNAAQAVTLSAAELTALLDGRTLAVGVEGKNVLYIAVDAEASEEFPAHSRVDGAAGPARFTERVRVRAAQVRVAADRRARVRTPKWIVELSKR
jgi:hypothetical protein